eukprot:scaffold9402_cov77-Cyclotella_meneghiniana.AAC.8
MMHNRNHTATPPPPLSPSPSIGDLKKARARTDSEDRRLRTRHGKATLLALAAMLSFMTFHRRASRIESQTSIDVVSPFVAQSDADIKCKHKSFPLNNSTFKYTPSSLERYIIDNGKALGYKTTKTDVADTCAIIRDGGSSIYNDLQQYFQDLENYNKLVRDFRPLQDLRLQFNSDEDKHHACEATKLHNDGLSGIFSSTQLVSASSAVGVMEPLLPTMRSHKICDDFETNLLAMDYMVHDFYSMCKQLQKHSRLIFIDMGASLDFHEDMHSEKPAIYIQSIYSKFGFVFDHIYAYEVNPKHPSKVFEAIPDELQSSWHWINVGVDARPCAKMNPFTMIENSFTKDDFIVVKLDIDTPLVEHALVEQLREDPVLLDLVDQFYFEHHVHQKELANNWFGTMDGNVGGSLKLMNELRTKGVAAHYWP